MHENKAVVAGDRPGRKWEGCRSTLNKWERSGKTGNRKVEDIRKKKLCTE
jgi:hypothetical protein